MFHLYVMSLQISWFNSYLEYNTSNMNFINRTKELQSLRKEFGREGSSLYILYGRRRLGKTTLLREFSKSIPSIYYLADQSLDRENIQSLAKTISLSRDWSAR